jgi:hypothetical protein
VDALKTIDRQLEDKQRFGRIQAAVKPNSSAALTKVELVNETVHIHPVTGKRTVIRTVTTIDTKLELEAAIIARNQRHFAQSEGTPFTKTPLPSLVVTMGLTYSRMPPAPKSSFPLLPLSKPRQSWRF